MKNEELESILKMTDEELFNHKELIELVRNINTRRKEGKEVDKQNIKILLSIYESEKQRSCIHPSLDGKYVKIPQKLQTYGEIFNISRFKIEILCRITDGKDNILLKLYDNVTKDPVEGFCNEIDKTPYEKLDDVLDEYFDNFFDNFRDFDDIIEVTKDLYNSLAQYANHNNDSLNFKTIEDPFEIFEIDKEDIDFLNDNYTGNGCSFLFLYDSLKKKHSTPTDETNTFFVKFYNELAKIYYQKLIKRDYYPIDYLDQEIKKQLEKTSLGYSPTVAEWWRTPQGKIRVVNGVRYMYETQKKKDSTYTIETAITHYALFWSDHLD